MAKLVEPLTNEQLRKITLVNLKNEYSKISSTYSKILNNEIVKCQCCGEWKNSDAFYASTTSSDGVEHFACKACILDMCTDYDKKTKIRTDNKDKTIETFKKLDWYFDEPIYNDQIKSLSEGIGERIRSTAVQQWIVMCRSLHQYKNNTFKDSIINDDSEVIEAIKNRKPRKEIIKLFGNGFTNDDYLYLQDQYDDWCARTQVDTKSQQTYIIRICFKLLDIYKAQKSGKDTEKLDKSLNEMLAAANLQPRQNVANASTDSLTFGQLIEKWEQEEPISEPEEEFKDVDGIGKYIRVWFAGWLSKALGLKNAYSDECSKEISKYTVTKPEYQEEGHSDEIYDKLFGSLDE